MIIIELAYSLHLGREKKKKNSAKNSAKSNLSGSTSLANNGIQSAAGLSKADKHNLRKYDNNSENIEIIKGTSSLYKDVQKLYEDEFEEARLEYNSRQTRDDRKINNYFTHVSNNSKNDLACEIIIELGNKAFWDIKDMNFWKKMTPVFKQQVLDLESIVPNFKIASAVIHFDEASPHLHIIGVPIKLKNKNGMKKQVGKSDVFTKESLKILQDKMRILCIEKFNQVYSAKEILAEKSEGRNVDYTKEQYIKNKQQIKNHEKNLKTAKQNSDKLDKNTKEIKDIFDNIKTKGIMKNQYVLSEDEKDKVVNFISVVDKTNKSYQKIQKLSVDLQEIDFNLLNSSQRINFLSQKSDDLSLQIEKLNQKINEKDEEILELKKENNLLKKIQKKFASIVHFLFDRIIRNKNKDKYMEFVNELYSHGGLDDEDIKPIIDISKSNNISRNYEKEKDDYEH